MEVVIRAGSGTNNIDKIHAEACGVEVKNTPGANKDAVAELTMGLALGIDRHIPDNV